MNWLRVTKPELTSIQYIYIFNIRSIVQTDNVAITTTTTKIGQRETLRSDFHDSNDKITDIQVTRELSEDVESNFKA